MAHSDPLSDLLTRIRNAQRVGHPSTEAPASNLKKAVLAVLEREGYIRGFSQVETRPGINVLKVELKYYEGQPVIRQVDRVSTPGRRVYTQIKNLGRFYNGLGISVLSTPKGVMSDNEARAANVGGEVLCRVY